MKRIFQKSMFFLTFVGIFTFVAPKPAMATNECPMYRICCGHDKDGDGEEDCFNVRCCTEHQLQQAILLLCDISISQVADKLVI